MTRYQAELIELDGVVTVKVTTRPGEWRYLVGYFRPHEPIHDNGWPIDPADIEPLPREDRA